MKYSDTDFTNTTSSEDKEPSSEEKYEVAPRFFKDFICLVCTFTRKKKLKTINLCSIVFHHFFISNDECFFFSTIKTKS
ncbi:hypothetical protein BpHYR1_015742 [Brachionus plicatilis]|uniref:Uncharacterized protein n=1 Tax=Brachionus plicatilis TaxID=10195 RepID=A0A3M7RDU3_BRAPC|nr:hypothetical protein BpHYR1_015742 [Brachionus plicatilis]